MHEMVQESWMRFNEPLEGIVNFMYLDVKGWVSTGMGNKIDETARPNSAPSAAERQASLRLANQLNWYDQSTGAAASPAEVASAWDAVKARLDLAPQGHRAFEGLTRLRVTNAEIARIVQQKLLEMERTLVTRPEFSSFSAWPANAQLGTLSMSWGMGPMFRFPKFRRSWRAGGGRRPRRSASSTRTKAPSAIATSSTECISSLPRRSPTSTSPSSTWSSPSTRSWPFNMAFGCWATTPVPRTVADPRWSHWE